VACGISSSERIGPVSNFKTSSNRQPVNDKEIRPAPIV
jgi:hypothetical protein